MSRGRSTLQLNAPALLGPETAPRRFTSFKTCTLKVFDYDEDGGLESRSEYKLAEVTITVFGSLFEQMTAVLPFDKWGRLYYYELDNERNRELLYERITANDQDFIENTKTLLDDYARRINRSPGRMCFHLHRRFP